MEWLLLILLLLVAFFQTWGPYLLVAIFLPLGLLIVLRATAKFMLSRWPHLFGPDAGERRDAKGGDAPQR